MKADKKRESDDISGLEFVDGYEFVTNILNDHVIPYVVLIELVNLQELVEDVCDVKELRDKIHKSV